MRYKAILNDEQMKYLLDNRLLSNIELAKRLNTTPQIIATYKYRARQAGIDIPKQKNTERNSVGKRMKEMSDENKNRE